MCSKVIRDVMGMPGLVATVGSDVSLAAAVVLMRAKNTQHMVVKDEDVIVGILSLDDILQRGFGLDHDHGMVLHEELTVANVMTPMKDGLEDSMNVEEALAKMEQYHASALPVVHRGALVAVVTKAELLRATHATPEAEPLEDVGRRGMVGLANPIVQRAMFLLGEAGI